MWVGGGGLCALWRRKRRKKPQGGLTETEKGGEQRRTRNTRKIPGRLFANTAQERRGAARADLYGFPYFTSNTTGRFFSCPGAPTQRIVPVSVIRPSRYRPIRTTDVSRKRARL